VKAAYAALAAAAPGARVHVNQCDDVQKDWQRAFWGESYPRLLRIKRRHDLGGLFTVHDGGRRDSAAWIASRRRIVDFGSAAASPVGHDPEGLDTRGAAVRTAGSGPRMRRLHGLLL
jgi:hypothetical protein